MNSIEEEIKSGERFEFGDNWKKFLDTLNENRIQEAKKSLKNALGLDNLEGKSFLDIGCGSGLFSLAAKKLGACVTSFDYDKEAVSCALELKKLYFPNDDKWQIERRSVLEEGFAMSPIKYDVVYSWGVLHHTGSMYEAITNASGSVKKGGLLFIAIYNKQPIFSPLWLRVKKLYNWLPGSARFILVYPYLAYSAGGMMTMDLFRGKNPLKRMRGANRRGMNIYHDAVDWVGGLPFEVATPEEVSSFLEDRGFELAKMATCGGKHGCNEFVLRRIK